LLLGYQNYNYVENSNAEEKPLFEHPLELPNVEETEEEPFKIPKETFVKSIKFITDILKDPSKIPTDYHLKIDKDNLDFSKRQKKLNDNDFSDLGDDKNYPDLSKQFFQRLHIGDDGLYYYIPTSNDENKEGYTLIGIDNDEFVIYFINENDEVENKFSFSYEGNKIEIYKDDKVLTSFLINSENGVSLTANEGKSFITIDNEGLVSIATNEGKTLIKADDNEIEVKVKDKSVLKLTDNGIEVLGAGDNVVLWSELKKIIDKVEKHIHPSSSGATSTSLDLVALGASFNSAKSNKLKTD